MKAIVLTYDRNHLLAEHMMEQYNKLWSDHPFAFRIPYQQNREMLNYNHHEYVKTPAGIRPTVLGLLDDVEDDEWIYWCIDDKYPIALDLVRVRRIAQWVRTIDNENVSGIMFCRCRELYRRSSLTGRTLRDNRGNMYLEHKGYEQIWIHQFVRAKVIRHLFEHFPYEIRAARSMERYKNKVKRPASHRLFVTRENCARFGESTAGGILTQNCYESLVRAHKPIPYWFSKTNGKHTVMGTLARGGPHALELQPAR